MVKWHPAAGWHHCRRPVQPVRRQALEARASPRVARTPPSDSYLLPCHSQRATLATELELKGRIQGADIARNEQGKFHLEAACAMPTLATIPLVRHQHAWKEEGGR